MVYYWQRPKYFFDMQNSKKIEWALRIGVAGEFIGHGLLAIGGKADWTHWISQLIGVSAPTAQTLLLLIGISDLIVALIVLVRPIVGVGWLDFIERFANWAAPLALYYFYKDHRPGSR